MDHIEKPDDLLEDIWFFGNSLDKKAKTKIMSRSYSDPSSKENAKLSDKKVLNLGMAPSLPPPIGGEIGSKSKGKSSLEKPKTSLERTKSLTPCVVRDEDVESEFSLSRLIRQASLGSSNNLPPKRKPKVTKQCLSAPRYRPQTKSLPENKEMETFHEAKGRSINVQNKLRRSVSEAKLQQVEHMETYYKFDKKDENPVEIPRFQEKPRIGYGESSSTDEMKAQIKYWARAVASNMR